MEQPIATPETIPAPTKTREKLTRERVIDAALQVMDAEGLEAVSMRRVAREVGVEAMSLYHYVKDKDDLLAGICDRVMADFEFPDATGDWNQRVRAGARSWRRVLQAHPDVMRLFAVTHGPSQSAPDALRPTEFALGLFKEAGLSDRDTVQAFHAFGGYIQGFAMMEGGSINPVAAAEDHLGKVASAVSAEDFPVLAAVSRHFAECDADEQFEFGLDLLIKGLRARVSADSSAEQA
ncbi:MAG: TetR/AcrR family transcriptional regulator [Actinomycetota bacterium]|nr:TetR/AcrR family transcriptional regulator [Actinomycetota bacterium]